MAETPVYTDADPTLAELLQTHPQLTVDPTCGLMLEGVALNAIADSVGTPCWVLGLARCAHVCGACTPP